METVAHETIRIERIFNFSPEQLFAAWSRPEAKQYWFGGHEDWESLEYHLDFRVGGSEINRSKPPGETEHLYDARIEDIVPDARIILAYTMTLGGKRISSSLATIEFLKTSEHNQTRLLFTEQIAVLDKQYPASGRETGWQEILGKLQKHLEESARADTRARLIKAPVELVYQMFSNPEHLARWWGPKGFRNTFNEFDLRKGGYWRFTMHGPDGKNYPNEIRFSEVNSNKKVVIEHLNGHHFFLSLHFIKSGDHTIVAWQQLFDTQEHYQQLADFIAKANEENLDKLEAEVQRTLKGEK